MGEHLSRDLGSDEDEGDALIEARLPRRKIVAVIGIDDYAGLPKLRCAVSDARGIQEMLVQRFGFEAPIPPLTNEAATKPAIESLVEDQLRSLLRPDDALILFFAGHGTTRVARLDEMTVETGYLAPVEARGHDRYSELINMEELLRKCGMLPARHILIVLDACHSGFALGTGVTQYRSMGPYVHRLIGNRSRRVITSARRDEAALDSGPIPGHSLFTGTLIQAMISGEADIDENGVVTFSELALVLQQKVGQASGSRQTPDYGAFHLDDRGEMVLAVSEAKPGPKEAARKAEPPRAPPPPRDTRGDESAPLMRDERMLAKEILRRAPSMPARDEPFSFPAEVGRYRLVLSVRPRVAKDRSVMRGLEHSLEMMEALEDRIRFLEVQKAGPAGLAFDFGREIRARRGELEEEAARLSEALSLLVVQARPEQG